MGIFKGGKGETFLFLPEGLILKVQFEDIDWEVQNRAKIVE